MGVGGKVARALQSIGVAAATVLIVAVAGEIALRAVRRRPAEEAARTDGIEFLTCDRDSLLGWTFPPLAHGSYASLPHVTDVRTNHLGIRNPPPATGPTRPARIIVLGDSYAFGWGVAEEEAFPRQLERMLLERYPDGSIEVLNAGVPGYGLYQQRAMLEHVLSDTDLDVVVSTFSLANDPVDDLRILRFAPDRLVEYSPDLREDGSVANWMITRSRLLAFLDFRTDAFHFKLVNSGGAALDAVAGTMRDLFAACDDYGLPVLTVAIPNRAEITATGFKAWLMRAQAARARRLHARIAEERGVPRIDVTEALRNLNEREGAYLSNDPHWTRAGHEVVAAEILRALPGEWLQAPATPRAR
jgi:lysophospholipase L1-like esterase